MLALRAIIQARPGKEKALEEVLLTMHRTATREASISTRALYRASKNRGRFLLYGRYTDRDSMERDLSGHYIGELSLKLEGLIEEPFDAELYYEIGQLER